MRARFPDSGSPATMSNGAATLVATLTVSVPSGLSLALPRSTVGAAAG